MYTYCIGKSQYIAVGNGGYFTSSLDGETWSEPVQTHKNDRIDWLNIEYANEMFLISGENQTGHYISYSKDGANWSEPVTDSGNGRMVFGNNLWIICDCYCMYGTGILRTKNRLNLLMTMPVWIITM